MWRRISGLVGTTEPVDRAISAPCAKTHTRLAVAAVTPGHYRMLTARTRPGRALRLMGTDCTGAGPARPAAPATGYLFAAMARHGVPADTAARQEG